MRLPLLVAFVLSIGCGGSSNDPITPPLTGGSGATEKLPRDEVKPDAGPAKDGGATSASSFRIVAANISSGNSPTYDPEETGRILSALHPDVALLQEMNVGDGTDEAMQAYAEHTLGPGFHTYREPDKNIPNAIFTRFPVLEAGHWEDPHVNDRGFVYAKIELPGGHPLWAVSVHFLTTGGSNRNAQAHSLVDELAKVVSTGDYVTIGGDLNTDGRGESCLSTLAQFASNPAPYPADHRGNDETNRNRNKPYDWVLVDPELATHQVPTVLGTSTFPNGLVFDSRVFTPLSDAVPAEKQDSNATNMQHMPVVRDFRL